MIPIIQFRFNWKHLNFLLERIAHRIKLPFYSKENGEEFYLFPVSESGLMLVVLKRLFTLLDSLLHKLKRLSPMSLEVVSALFQIHLRLAKMLERMLNFRMMFAVLTLLLLARRRRRRLREADKRKHQQRGKRKD